MGRALPEGGVPGRGRRELALTMECRYASFRCSLACGLALAVACGCVVSGRRAECCGRGRIVSVVSGVSGHGHSAGAGERYQYGGDLAGAADLSGRVLARRAEEPGGGVAMGAAGLLGGTAGAVVLPKTPQTMFTDLAPWLLLGAAGIFAVSGP